MDFSNPLILIFIVVFVGMAIALRAISAISGSGKNPKDLQYEKRKNLMTPAEREFFDVLKESTNNQLRHFSKVRLEDIIQVKKGVDKKVAYGLRNRIKSRHIDFVLCDSNTSEIKACIELDDRSHSRTKVKERDQFVNEALEVAGIPLLRFQVKPKYDSLAIKKEISDLLLQEEKS